MREELLLIPLLLNLNRFFLLRFVINCHTEDCFLKYCNSNWLFFRLNKTSCNNGIVVLILHSSTIDLLLVIIVSMNRSISPLHGDMLLV